VGRRRARERATTLSAEPLRALFQLLSLPTARMVKLAATGDLKSLVREDVPVRARLWAPPLVRL
jgi:hypothetical protein